MNNITVDAVKKLLDAHEDYLLLDVRTPEEYAKGAISGSKNIPVDQIGETVSTIIPNREQKVIVYCLSGSRSMAAVQMMMDMGYTQVYTMTSGLLAWRAKHYPLETP